MFYLIAKDRSAEMACVALTELLHFLYIAAVDHITIEQVRNLPYSHFEDAVQMMTAVQVGAQCVVTRNVQDYKAGPLPAL